MNRRQCLTTVAGGVALAPTSALANPLLDDDTRWVRQQRRTLRRLRTARPDPEVRRVLRQEGLPGNLEGEALAAIVLARAFNDLPRARRRSEPVQDLLWDEADRVGGAMATWVSWLDGLSPERRDALDAHFEAEPADLDLATGHLDDRLAPTGLDLSQELRRARRLLRRRTLRWGLETLLRQATRDARTEGLPDDQWRDGRFRGGVQDRQQGQKPPPPAARRRGRLPPIIAWGLRMLGVGCVFLAAGWSFAAMGAVAIGALFLWIGLIFLVIGLAVLLWGAIAIGLGFHLPPPQRRGKKPPPKKRPPPR